MHLPPNARVYSSNGQIGHATQLIVNPVSKTFTHVVVKADGLNAKDHLVPLDLIKNTSEKRIDLNCTKEQFDTYPVFTETHFMKVDIPSYAAYGSGYGMVGHPYRSYEHRTYAKNVKLIPPDELALKRGMHVDAKDGHVGRIDEFIIDETSGHMGHLVMRQGHIFGVKDVFIPVADVEKIEYDRITLKLVKHEINALKHIPTKELGEKVA